MRAAAGNGLLGSRSPTTGSAAPHPTAGSGLRGLADRAEAHGGALRRESSGGRRDALRGDPVRVVIADDPCCSATASRACSPTAGRGRRRRPGTPRSCARPSDVSARRRDRRRAHAADPDRRGRARRARDLRRAPRGRRCSCCRSRGGAARPRLVGEAAGGGRLPAQGPRARGGTSSSRPPRPAGRNGLDPEVVAQLLGRRGEDDRSTS